MCTGIRLEETERTLGVSGADGSAVRGMFPQLHMLPPVRQEVCEPPAGGVRHIQLGELVLQQSRNDCIESRTEVHKQDPGIDS